MLRKNIASQGTYLYAVDTNASPVAGKTGDASNITGAWSKDGGAETAGFTTAHPTEIGGGVYWQPYSQAETNGNRISRRWASSTSGVVIDPLFEDSTADIFAATGTQAAAVWDEVNTATTHNVANSAGKQLRLINPNSDAIYPTSGTVNLTAATSATATLDASASAVSQAYQFDVLNILTGTGAGQSRVITNYTTGRVATVSPAFTTTPDATSTFDITPTASVQVVSYIAGQDPATLVWAAATRTLTALPAITTDWLTGTGVAASAVTKIQAGLSTYAGGDTSGTTTLLARLTATRAGLLDNLDAAISTRSTYAGGDTSGTTTLLSRLTSTRAGLLDNLDAAVSTRSTYAGGAVASVTAAVTLPSIPNNWITAAGIASDADAEIAGAVWDLATSGHTTAGTFGAAATAGGSGPSAEAIATAVWQDATAGDFTVVGSVGELVFGQPTAEEVAVIVDTQLTSTHGSGSWLSGSSGLSDVDIASVASAVWDEVNTAATHNVPNSAGRQLRAVGGNTTAIYTSSPIPDQTGMTSTTVKLDPGADDANGAYEGAAVWVTFGTGQGGGICTNYVGSTRVATINVAWDVRPVEGDAVEVTPSGYAIVAGYRAGQDPATMVWAASPRTLTALPAMPTDWVTDIGVSAGAVTKIQAGLSTYTGEAADAGINALLGRLTDARAGYLDNLVLLDRAISTRSTYSGGDTAGTTTLLARLTDTRATYLNNLANLDATVSTRATDAGAADKLLGRNIAGGSDGGRTVAQAMAFLRNKKVIASSILTVYENNDSSVSWTATVATSPSNPVTGVDPA